MRPTIDEQLDGVRRLLDAVGEDEGLSTASRELLRNAGRLVHRVRGSWATTLPFLVEDNATLAALLAEVGPASDDEPAPTDVTPTEVAAADVSAAADRNTALRARLAETIRTLPRTGEGLAARARIGEYLRRRVAADPT